jgi:hypothetical protein
LCPTEFKLLPEEIERWFTKIDHIFEHTRIRHEEVLTAFYKTSVDKIQWHPRPIASHINYKYDLSVLSFEDYILSSFNFPQSFCYIHLSFKAIRDFDRYKSVAKQIDLASNLKDLLLKTFVVLIEG